MPTPPAPPPLPPPHLASAGSGRQLGGPPPPSSDPRTATQQKQLTHVLNLWKSNPPSTLQESGGGRSNAGNHANGSFASGGGGVAGPPAASQKELQQLRVDLETLQLKLSQMELRCLQSDQVIAELQSALAISGQERMQAQRQIERLSEGLESETLKAQEHRAQITYLTAQVKLLSEQRLDTTQATYWAVAGWVYVPLLLLVKGLWVILFPLISTIRRLSLFSGTTGFSSSSGGGNGQSARSSEEARFLHEREYADHPVTHMMKASRFGSYADRSAKGLGAAGKSGAYGGQSKGSRSAGGLRNWHEAMMTPEARLQGSFAPIGNESFGPGVVVGGGGGGGVNAFDFGGQPSLLALLRSGALDPEPIPGVETSTLAVGPRKEGIAEAPKGNEAASAPSEKGAAIKQVQTPSSKNSAPFPTAATSSSTSASTSSAMQQPGAGATNAGQWRGSLQSTTVGPPPSQPQPASSSVPVEGGTTSNPTADPTTPDPITAAAETVISAIPFDDIPLSPITRTASNLASFLTQNQR
jgi:hypothetical protein